MKDNLKRFFLSLSGGLLGVLLGVILGGMLMYFYVASYSLYAQKPNIRNVDTTLLGKENPTHAKKGKIVIPNTMNLMQKAALVWEISGSDKDIILEKNFDDGVGQKSKIGVDFYLCEITDFYESLVTILFSTIGIILFFGFLYVYNASRKRADDMARNALKEDSFKIKLNKQIDEAVASIFAANNTSEKIEEYEYKLEETNSKIIPRIKFLEKEITKLSYPAVSDVISEEPQKESS